MTLWIDLPSASRASTSADNSGRSVRVRMFSTFRAPELLSVQRAAIVSTSSGGDNPMESLSLNFIKVMVTPTPLDKSGQIKKGDVVSYDLLAMKAS